VFARRDDYGALSPVILDRVQEMPAIVEELARGREFGVVAPS